MMYHCSRALSFLDSVLRFSDPDLRGDGYAQLVKSDGKMGKHLCNSCACYNTVEADHRIHRLFDRDNQIRDRACIRRDHSRGRNSCP